ncbi:MAG: nickel pincer cofactor biosynthesis protein LarC [Clostridia bacterium]|nr:nickel pincer cofactor biosynthesis protein LarC [Clostridia bacterium]
MKLLYFDCGMGAAGDMLTAALLDLLPDPEEAVGRLNAIGVPGVRFRTERAVQHGIAGRRCIVEVNGEEEAHVHAHHTHHDHHHRTPAQIDALIDGLALPPEVRAQVRQVYARLAQAESAVHGVPVTEIHFHEVGTLDAVADIAAVCLLLHELAPDAVVASPVRVGFGTVRCAHGTLPVPAPATAALLQGIPVYAGDIEGELCTPTGAALLQQFVTRFERQPEMTPSAVGYGMGKKEFSAPNCVRAWLGETAETPAEDVTTLACNLDDMTPEAIAYAAQRLLDAGALDVWTVPIGMKKSRPGTQLCLLCRPEEAARFAAQFFRYTTTLGVRVQTQRRYTLVRREETAETPFGPMRRKVAEGFGVTRSKLEYEDVARAAAAEDCALFEIRRAAEDAKE